MGAKVTPSGAHDPRLTGELASTRQVAGWIVVVAALHVALAAPRMSESVWLDEAVTIQLCVLPLSIDTTATNDATPPVYYLVVQAWSALFGCDAHAIRALSLLLSTLALALLIVLGNAWLDLRTGVVAAVLFAISNLQLRYATEARCYTLVEVLLLASYGCFLALRAAPRRRTAVALGLLNAAIVQTHYVAALGLLPQLADVVLFRLRDRELLRRYVPSQILAVALCVPWATLVALRWPPITPHWLALPDVATLDYNFRLLLATPLEPLWYLLAVVVVLVATATRAPERLAGGALERLTVLVAWGVGVPLVAFAVSRSVSIVLPRYLLFASLGLFLLLAYVVSLAPVRGWRRAALVGLLVVPTLIGVTTDPVPRADWRHAIEIARSHAHPHESQIVAGPEWEALPIGYHVLGANGMGTIDSVLRNLGFEGVRVARDPEVLLADLPATIDTVVLVSPLSSEHVAVLAMPQLCFLRERFAAYPRELSVRVLERDCALG